MGRAERRRSERINRINSRKDKLLIDKKDLADMRSDIVDTVGKYDVEALMTCFALAEHRLFGFGMTRIIRSLEYVDELMGDVLKGAKSIDEYKQELTDETGVAIKFDI